MNRKERRITRAQGAGNGIIQFRGKSLTISEAYELAIRQQQTGQFQDAVDIFSRILIKLPDHADTYSNMGVILHGMGRYEEALANCDKAIALDPDSAAFHYNRGNSLQALKRFGEAVASYDRAIALDANFAGAYNNRGISLQDMKRYDEALQSCDKAIALAPDFAEAYNNRANILRELKRYDESLANCDKAIALKADYANAYNSRGAVLVNKGDMAEAEKMFLKALALRPDFPNPLFGLANIRKYRDANHPDIQNMRQLLGKTGISAIDREHLFFTLGKMYDDCGQYDDAFECYRQANEIRNLEAGYNAAAVSAMTSSIIEFFSKDFLAQKFAFASESATPIFVVGMPRSGTTLMASILSNHRAIGTAGELPTITDFTTQLPHITGTPYPQAVARITPDMASRMTAEYEQRLRRDFGPDMPHIVDKQPFNFAHLGFISMLFPKARIIHCTRDAMDTALSNYFQRFPLSYGYSFDLKNIAHFYGEYARLMRHWNEVLPQKILDVSYEGMTADTEKLARRALDFLGLEWDERCLSPHTNPYAVETASNWQVRQPIYRQSVERWRHYEKFVQPLHALLAGVGAVKTP